jgi:hypothetical protein
MFQVYVNSYFALLNARYYIQPNDSDAIDISEFRAHRPPLHSRGLEAERLQESRENVFNPYDHDDTLHATCLVQVAMVSSRIIVDKRGLNDMI